jgi:hypothetical protein
MEIETRRKRELEMRQGRFTWQGIMGREGFLARWTLMCTCGRRRALPRLIGTAWQPLDAPAGPVHCDADSVLKLALRILQRAREAVWVQCVTALVGRVSV